MSEYNEGDLLEASKGKTMIRGPFTEVGYPRRGGIDGTSWRIEDLERSGYTLTVIEKAAPPLPTEPGIYTDKDGDPWRITTSGELKASSQEYAPFTRLEPVAVTAQKVIEFIGSSWEFGPPLNVTHVLDDASTEFGVIK